MTSQRADFGSLRALGAAGAGQHAVKLARSLYSGRIASVLRESIIDGALPAGTPLAESRLAEQLSVSRGPIRSALQVLEGEGLVRTLPNGRMVVVGFGPGDLEDLLSVRFELESAAVRRGVAASADIAPIREAYNALLTEGASTERLVELDIDFHRSLVVFSGSRFLLSAWSALAPVIQAVITIGNRRLAAQDPASNFERIIASHELIVNSLTRYDRESVVEMLRKQFSLTSAMFRPEDTESGSSA